MNFAKILNKMTVLQTGTLFTSDKATHERRYLRGSGLYLVINITVANGYTGSRSCRTKTPGRSFVHYNGRFARIFCALWVRISGSKLKSVKIVARNRRSRYSFVSDRSARDQYHMRWLSRKGSPWQETYVVILTSKESVMELRIRKPLTNGSDSIRSKKQQTIHDSVPKVNLNQYLWMQYKRPIHGLDWLKIVALKRAL